MSLSPSPPVPPKSFFGSSSSLGLVLLLRVPGGNTWHSQTGKLENSSPVKARSAEDPEGWCRAEIEKQGGAQAPPLGLGEQGQPRDRGAGVVGQRKRERKGERVREHEGRGRGREEEREGAHTYFSGVYSLCHMDITRSASPAPALPAGHAQRDIPHCLHPG